MTRTLCILPLIVAGAWSCDSVKEDCGGSGILPGIDAVIESDIKTDFVSGDRIGIYPVSYNGGTAGSLGDVSDPLNLEYYYNGRFWSPVGDEGTPLNGTTMDIYAYYPYDEGLSRDPGKTNVYAYPFDLSGDQSARDTDFLWAKSTGVSEDANSTLLVFSHLFTRFVINLNYNDSDPTEAGLEVHNVWPHVLIDLSNGSVNTTEVRDEVIPVLQPTPEPQYDLTYIAIVPPQRIGQGTALFTMDNDGDTSVFYLSGDRVFRPGYTYIFNLIIGSIEVTPQSRAIAPDKITVDR